MTNAVPSSTRASDAAAKSSATRYAVFRRCNQQFALSIDLVSEVLPGQPLTRVPRSQSQILGVLSLRGEILPVLTLDDLLGLSAPTDDPNLPILVLRQGELLAGLRVDAIQSVVSIPASEIQPYPAEGEACFAGIWHPEGMIPMTLIASAALIDALRRQTTETL
jgi:chemotaxis signal transduction protein